MAGVVDYAVILGVVVLIVLQTVALVAVYAARYKRVPPNQAMVLYGRRYQGGKGFEVWTGGGKFILPIVESYVLISLEPFRTDLLLDGVIANARDPTPALLQVSVDAVSRVSDDPDALKKSAGMLIHKPPEEIKEIVARTLEGHVRGVIASATTTTPDPVSVTDEVLTGARSDLSAMGIEVRTLFLKFRPIVEALSHDVSAAERINREPSRDRGPVAAH